MKIQLIQNIIDMLRGKKGPLKNIKGEKWFNDCLNKFNSLDKTPRFIIKKENFWKCIGDNTEGTGIDPHYEYQQAWAARILAKNMPSKHIDISSKITFNSITSAFIPFEFYDFRPAKLYLDNLECKQADLTNLHFETESVESLSCMHTVEHVGLGRYGDNIDPNGDLIAISELKRVLKRGGDLLFVVPVGKPMLQYNAHRIYSYEMVMEYFQDLTLMDFSLIPDDAAETGMIKNAKAQMVSQQSYACGCFWFRKD